MSRLIEIPDVSLLPAALTLQINDALLITATGGRVCGSNRESNQNFIELIGIFVQSIIGINNQIISPIGSPNTVLFIACYAGHSTIEIMTGNPWNNPQTTTIEVTIMSS